MSGLTILLMVALRVAIGWHFFNEGRDHYFDKKWSSQGFLKIATGPFAAQAKATLPQHHHWDTHIGRAFTDEEYAAANAWYNDKLDPGSSKTLRKAADDRVKELVAEKKSKAPDEPAVAIFEDQHPLYVNPIYGAWAKQVRDDWRGLVAEADRHYSYNEEQKKQSQEQLQKHLELLYGKLDGLEKELFEYRAELRRYQKMLADPSTDEIPFEKDRVAAKKKELAGKPGPWINDLMYVESWLRSSLDQIAGSEAVAKNPLPEPVPTYKKIDPIVIWLLMIGGACLIVGLFTRLAAFALGVFLLSVVLLQPFWVADAVKTTYFEWVEVLALFTLATTGIGRYAGLDYFIHALLGGKPVPEIEKTERTVVTKRA
jgi:uncharacterized membrane protein YphA (DoxX/SURF4 family)